MTVVEKEESGCCCTCIICCSCFFSVLCVICAICAIFSDNDDSSPDCYDDSPSDCCVDSLPTTYIHKCSSCDKEIARFTY
ncbi:hypothetical protein J6590_069163 [Homalodisca vitripennis]|nr:hypothetical protein J6590_069163 [Homalodisca vitripennis]